MASTVLIPVQEYLSTTYRPDVDYIDGELKERNVGERPHSLLQIILGAKFYNHRNEWHLLAMGDQRVQISSSHYRVADLCVVRDTDPADLIVTVAPVLCVEILSRGDSLSELQERVDDYASIGVGTIWAIDPWRQKVYHASTCGFDQPTDGVLRVKGSAATITASELFAEIAAV